MAYTKKNWRTDDVITAEKLNNAEQGIAQSTARQATGMLYLVIGLAILL